jgi:tRNA threonylcarbamoyladenosine biosynthesis protein TsaE
MLSGLRMTLAADEDMIQLGHDLGQALFDGAVIGLTGPLGAGKTTISRGVAEGMGIDSGYIVSSPTYTLMQSYPCSGRDLHHLDLYRIEGPEDLDSTGYRDKVGGRSVLLVEWPEREPSVLPAENLVIKIEYCKEGRQVEFIPTGKRYEELVEQIDKLTAQSRRLTATEGPKGKGGSF